MQQRPKITDEMLKKQEEEREGKSAQEELLLLSFSPEKIAL